MRGRIYCLALGAKEFYCDKNILCKDDSKFFFVPEHNY